MNAGSPVTLNVHVGNIPQGSNQNTDIIWERRGDEITDTQILPSNGPSFTVNSAFREHAGVYNVYWRELQHIDCFIRLIVRGNLRFVEIS